MARFCSVMRKGVQVGNRVSHANNKTKRRFLPNLQQASFWSDSLKKRFRLRLSVHGIRTIEHRGGLDAFLLSTPSADLPSSLRSVKARLSA